MDLNQFLNIINGQGIVDAIFKLIMIVLTLLYLIYTIVLSKQMKIMSKTLEDKFNSFIFLVCSIQTTVALILLIFVLFLI